MPNIEELSASKLTAKQFDKALDKLNKRYRDVADKIGVTDSAVWQWVHTSNNIPSKHRKKVLNILIKWKEEMEETKEEDTNTGVTQVSENDDKEKPKKKEEPKPDYDSIRKRRTKLGLNQEVCAGAIGSSTWTYSHKERKEGNYSFTLPERDKLNAFFDHIEDICENGFLVKKADPAKESNKDLDFALDMLKHHIEYMEEGTIKSMALKYVDLIKKEVKS